MKQIFFIAVLLSMTVLPVHGDGAEPTRLRINCSIHSRYEAFFMRVLETICDRNDIVIEHHTPPVGRSLINVDEGIADGDGPRISGLSALYPNLVRVPEPFGEFHFGAFARSPGIRLDGGWESLEHLNVSYVHGWKIFDERVTLAKSIVKVKNAELLFGLLESGRADVVLMSRFAGYAAMDRSGLKDFVFIEPPLAVEPNYLYLNKTHGDKVEIIAAALREMKANGEYDKLSGEMLSQ